jgi:hypothetical protein
MPAAVTLSNATNQFMEAIAGPHNGNHMWHGVRYRGVRTENQNGMTADLPLFCSEMSVKRLAVILFPLNLHLN